MAQLKINEGYDPATGIQEVTHFQEGEIIVEKRYDAQPHLEYAQALREAQEGQRWGDGKIVGHIPPAAYAAILQIRDNQERQQAIKAWLFENSKFVTFDRFLK